RSVRRPDRLDGGHAARLSSQGDVSAVWLYEPRQRQRRSRPARPASGSGRGLSLRELPLLAHHPRNTQTATARGRPMTLRRWILMPVLFGLLIGCNNNYSSGDRVLVTKFSYDNGLTG